MPDRKATAQYTMRALDVSTWEAFAELVQRGVLLTCPRTSLISPQLPADLPVLAVGQRR